MSSVSRSALDFLAIGDAVVDEFITLEDAKVHCNIDDENCTISMRWGDKIPYETAEMIAGVGNAANAAVAAARLGLSASVTAHIGTDRNGDDIIDVFKKEGLDTRYVTRQEDVPTNHHYVLSFHSERTILVKHEHYDYQFPADMPAPKTMYVSSLADGTEAYHDDMTTYLEAHPDIFVVFQPGTFQMKMGAARLARLYARADLFVCNKEEAARILGIAETDDVQTLANKLRALGPKTVIITDGSNGAYAFNKTESLMVPMYPDQKTPFDRTGAGDAFASTVAVALTDGIPLNEALLWGPINSMSVVSQLGAQRGLLTRDAVMAYLKKAPETYKVSPL